MKAIVQNIYGDESVLQMKEIETPVISKDELLIEVHYANIASGDMRINTLDIPTLLKPIARLVFGCKGPRRQVRGITGSGVITQVGENVTNLNVGDKVYYINSMKAGCMAEYLVLNKKSILAKVPSNMSLEQAAPLAFGAMTALHFINENTVKPGNKVLIYGASGSVGTYAIQLAKYLGAEVTAICSKKNHDVVTSLGADHVIDYKTTDFTTQTKQYDVVFDTVLKTKKNAVKRVLTQSGKYITTASPSSEKVERLKQINEIIEKNKLTSYIEKTYPFDEYKEAHRHVYSKHKVGNVVLKIK